MQENGTYHHKPLAITLVHTCKVKPVDKFGYVFVSSLGSIPGEVHLQNDASFEPSVLPPRRLPHAMKARVKQESDSLVDKMLPHQFFMQS